MVVSCLRLAKARNGQRTARLQRPEGNIGLLYHYGQRRCVNQLNRLKWRCNKEITIFTGRPDRRFPPLADHPARESSVCCALHNTDENFLQHFLQRNIKACNMAPYSNGPERKPWKSGR
jgi:hypothetical protein